MLSVETQSDATIVALSGRLDGITTPTIEPQVAAILASEPNVVLDLTELSYVASVGLRLVLLAAKRTRQAKRRFAVCGLRPQVHEVFEVAGLDMLMTICPSRDDALAVVRAP